MLHRLLSFVSSLKLTIVTLAAALVLVFAGTMTQLSSGIHEVQLRYFQSLFIWCPLGSQGLSIPVFPGGHLIFGVLLINLIAAHLHRFRWSWNKLGIQLIHAGLIILLAGCLFTDFYAVESFIRLAPGETRSYSEDQHEVELAVFCATNHGFDEVAVFPEARFRQGVPLGHPNLPFQVIVRKFYQNACVVPLAQSGADAKASSTQGTGAHAAISELPPRSSGTLRDLESAVIEIIATPTAGKGVTQSLGTWLLSDRPASSEEVLCAGQSWRIEIRPKRYVLPCSLTLLKFTHEQFSGTDIAKKFASQILLIDPERHENREVLITMNHPLRYRGQTFYQSGFEVNDSATVLQVVENPVSFAPYLACLVVAAGLILQFASSFSTFTHRKQPAPLS